MPELAEVGQHCRRRYVHDVQVGEAELVELGDEWR